MARLLTDAQVLAVRLRNAKPYTIAELDLELRMVKPSAAASFELQELRAKVQEGKAKLPELVLMVLQASCADLKGQLLDKAAAEQILGLMSIDAMNELVAALGDTGSPAGNPSGSPESA